MAALTSGTCRDSRNPTESYCIAVNEKIKRILLGLKHIQLGFFLNIYFVVPKYLGYKKKESCCHSVVPYVVQHEVCWGQSLVRREMHTLMCISRLLSSICARWRPKDKINVRCDAEWPPASAGPPTGGQ